ncbi:TetR/AcrR family transcriptional regulator [Dactylosporangium matsuzakiense]|uniref:TetR family transcriptional regulator n=1 Tax=Dactylosporangium matsuzakiense TaxID=53360 RepID=A0A9W6NRC4_9ACTN|nr:TetR/AcrR family transcriptional regulator [Dactylosporangium matsuzakiense]UWZ48599.1 TetR/AcrR family transcriptional regulator [Dactylosporangium matsuzakiense]GLL06434.1 TetR family transcriptional regulator [Dactylosporangium matsuzakiense]
MNSDADPRFQRSRQAILSAARALLLEKGPVAVTHAQVAERAGVGRATVYRHWPRSDELLAEAMATVPMPLLDNPTAPTRQWLTRELTTLAEQLALADVRAVATTLASTALWDQQMDARRAQFATILAERLAGALDAAQDRGEVTLAVPVRDAAAFLVGPIYYRSTIEHGPAGSTLIETLIAAIGAWSAP